MSLSAIPFPAGPSPASPDRARMVAAAQALYFQQGMAEVEMADVAHYLRLPESLVRHHFPEKAALVEAVVDAHAHAIYQELALHHERSSTAVEELLALRNWASEDMKRSLHPFFQQLETDYPVARLRWQAHMAGFPVEHLRNNLRWGILQDLYRPDMDVEQAVQRWFAHTGILRTAAGVEAGEMHRTLLERFLAGIVTPGGALVARRLQEAYPFY